MFMFLVILKVCMREIMFTIKSNTCQTQKSRIMTVLLKKITTLLLGGGKMTDKVQLGRTYASRYGL